MLACEVIGLSEVEVLQAEDLFETEALHVPCSGSAGLVLRGSEGAHF